MDNDLGNIENITLEGGSRSSRWKKLRSYLKQVVRLADANSDRLASIEAEAAQIRESNLRLAEIVQVLGDLANEEVQREISMTLNDDFDIVVDTDPQLPTDEPADDSNEPEALTIEEFIDRLEGIPGIGPKKLNDISRHLNATGLHRQQPTLDFGEKDGETNE